MNFNFSLPTKLHFGINNIELLPNIAKSYGRKCLLVTTKNVPPLDELFSRVKKILTNNKFEVIHFDKVIPNPTIEIVEHGIKLLQKNNIDFILSVGGGSSIDTGKIICLLNEHTEIDWNHIFNTYTDPHATYKTVCAKYIPHIAIPTTAGTGSEVTQAAVISVGKNKNTIFHQLNYPDIAILDPNLLVTLPKRLTASTGFDAFCHAFESYINPSASMFSELASIEAIRTIRKYLPKAIKDLKNVNYRKQLMYAQTLAGISLSNAGASTPHPLSEVIGGVTGISHGEALALIFPQCLQHQYKLNITKFATIARIFDESLITTSDEKAASKLSNIITDFLKKIDLYYKFEDYKITNEQFDAIINCPVLNFLPFGSKEDLQNIIIAAKQSR